MPRATLISMEMHQCLTRDSKFTTKIQQKCISIQHAILTVYTKDRDEMHQYSTRDSNSLHRR